MANEPLLGDGRLNFARRSGRSATTATLVKDGVQMHLAIADLNLFLIPQTKSIAASEK
jgi:hypothetical protein